MKTAKRTTALLCCLCLLLSLTPVVLSASADSTVYLLKDHTDKYKTQGRTLLKDGVLLIDWSASGIEFQADCEGDVYVTFSVSQISTDAERGCYFTLVVDGVTQARDACWLRETGEISVKIASGLSKGKHTFAVYRQNEISSAITVGVKSISLVGDLLDKPKNNAVYLEFIGDSITTAYSNLSTSGQGQPKYQDATQGYAYLCAQALQADFSLVAIEGIGASTGWQTFPMLDVYPKWRYTKDKTTEYSFSRSPDVVVLALGTNDINRYAANGKTLDDVKQGFSDMLALVRQKNPQSKVVWIYNMMTGSANSLINEVMSEAGGEDAGLYTLQLLCNNEGGNGHPLAAAHKTNAETLAAYLKDTVLPSDLSASESDEPGKTATELITNGDFEQGASGTFAWVAGNGITIEDGVGFGGGKALCISDQGTAHYFKNLSLDYKPNTRYLLSFYAKGPAVRFTDNTANATKPKVLFGGGYLTQTTTSYDQWAQYRIEFVTGDTVPAVNANYGFYFIRQSGEEGLTYIDNFSIVESDETVERVIGGDFSAVGLQQWWGNWLSKESTLGITVTSEGDNRVLYLPPSATGWGTPFFPSLALETSSRYKVSFRIKGAPINLSVYSGGGVVDGAGWQTTSSCDEWVTCSFEFTTGASLNQNSILGLTRYLSSTLNTTQGTYLDDFSVKFVERVQATAISLNKSTCFLERGGTQQLTVSASPNGSTYETVVWSSADESIATVSANGVVTAGNTLGKTVVTATSGQLTASCTVSVVQEAEGFSLNEKTAHLAPPAKNGALKAAKQLTLKAEPLNAYIGEVQWNTSDSTVVTVDSNGMITALKEGQAVITVCSANGLGSDSCTVTVDCTGELLTGGDFENDAWDIAMWNTKIITDTTGQVVIDSTDSNNYVLQIPGNMACQWLWPVPMDAGKLYQISFRARSDTAGTKLRYELTTGHVEVGGGVYEKELSTQWQTYTHVFALNADNLNRNYAFGFRNMYVTEYYIDDVSLVQIGAAVEADASITNGSLTFAGADGTNDKYYRFDETVTVTVNAEAGYLLKVGSLLYQAPSGKMCAILNEEWPNDTTFGGTSGKVFQFPMPKYPITVTAQFLDTSTTNFCINTVGTSLHNDGNGDYDGIRFLTRLALASETDLLASEVTVQYNGMTYTVKEFGTLLKRSSNETELTVEAQKAAEETGSNRMWRAVAYTQGEDMRLVDYTDAYLDFTVIMKRGTEVTDFYSREYTARGYMILEAADGTSHTVYSTGQWTSSVDSVQQALA